MPVGPISANAPSTAPPYADVLVNNRAPARSATSDMPVVEAPEPAPAPSIDTSEAQPDTPPTSDPASGGEADAQPTKEGGGEEKDQTSPQQRAAFARERNRRQAAEQRATALETQFAQLTEAVAKLTERFDPPKDDPRPVRDTFDTPDAYDKALEGWAERRATEKAKAEAKTELEQQQRESQRKVVLDGYNERKAAFEANHPDFDDVVYSDDVKISPVMTQAILEAEDGPAIAYWLGQNPDEAERIAGLTPARAAIEIGRISSKLAAPPKPKPAPIRPLTTRTTAEPKSPSEMSMAEYAEYRKARVN